MLRYSWIRARLSLKHKLDQDLFEIKQAQIDIFKKVEDWGFLDLYYGDESHFGLTPNVPYAWQTKDNPILLSAAKGKFLNVVGFMTLKNNLLFEVIETAFDTDKIIRFIDGFLAQTIKNYCNTG